MSDKPTIEDIERSINEDGVASVEISPDGTVVQKNCRTVVEVIREIKDDEILLVTVSGGALTEQSLGRIAEFVEACRDPSKEVDALLIEAETLDEIHPQPPATIEVSVIKRDDVAKGIAIVEREQ